MLVAVAVAVEILQVQGAQGAQVVGAQEVLSHR
jgi:hypothetical protein